MTNFEHSFLINNLYYDYSKRVSDNSILEKLGYYNENNIVEIINFMEFMEVQEKYTNTNKELFNSLTDSEMNDVLTGINIVNNKNYELKY